MITTFTICFLLPMLSIVLTIAAVICADIRRNRFRIERSFTINEGVYYVDAE